MTAETPELPQPVDPAWDDEFDLRQYLAVLGRWWREILLFTVLAAVAAGLLVFLLQQFETPRYRANSDVLIARVVNVANLDERLQTVAEEPPSTARRSALVGLAKSGAVAAAVIEEMGDTLPVDLQEPAALLERVEAVALPSSDNRTPSDLIRITATAGTPARAATIANIWADTYVRQINDLIGQVPAEVLDSVEEELIQADEAYQAAQAALEAFIAGEQSNRLEREIADRQAQLDTLQMGRQTAVDAVIDRELAASLQRYINTVDAQTRAAQAVFVEDVESRLDQLSDLYAIRTRIGQSQDQAELLLAQIEAGGDAAAATNGLALQLLKTQIFAATANTRRTAQTGNTDSGPVGDISASRQTNYSLPANLMVDVGQSSGAPQTAEEQAADVTALISALTAYQAEIDDHIAQISAQLAAGTDLVSDTLPPVDDADGAETESAQLQATVAPLDQLFTLDNGATVVDATDTDLTALETDLHGEIQRLQSQLEAESARKLRLTQQRDLAWNAYDTLSNKVVELTLEKTAANSEVRLASPAIPPIKPVEGPNPRLMIMMAGALGFLFGVFYAYVASYLGQEPFLRRRRSQTAAG